VSFPLDIVSFAAAALVLAFVSGADRMQGDFVYICIQRNIYVHERTLL